MRPPITTGYSDRSGETHRIEISDRSEKANKSKDPLNRENWNLCTTPNYVSGPPNRGPGGGRIVLNGVTINGTKQRDQPPSFNYGDRPSTGVIRAGGMVQRCEPTALTPLQGVIDVDALNALFDKPEETDLSVSFEYDECVVEVTNDGTITIRGASDAGSRELDQETNVLFLAPSSSHP